MPEKNEDIVYRIGNLPQEGFLVDSIFHEFEESRIHYCVERNYERYPNIITGDVDIIVRGSDLNKAVHIAKEVAIQIGWLPFITYIGSAAAHIGFLSQKEGARFVLTIEFFAGGIWQGLPFISPDRVIQLRQKHGDYWKPCAAHEAIITLVHHLLYNKKVFNKYRPKIKFLAQESAIEFEKELSIPLGPKTAKALCSLVLSERWDDLEKISGDLRRVFILRSFLLRPISSLSGILQLALSQRNKPKGLIISIYNSNSNNSEKLAKKLIDLATSWHIFLPPNRFLFKDYQNNKQKIKKTIRSGGIALLINPKEHTRFEISKYPYSIDIFEGNGKISIKNGIYASEFNKSDSLDKDIWRVILKRFTK